MPPTPWRKRKKPAKNFTYITKVCKIVGVCLFTDIGGSKWVTKQICFLLFGSLTARERLKRIIQFKGIWRIQLIDRSFPWIKIIDINSNDTDDWHCCVVLPLKKSITQELFGLHPGIKGQSPADFSGVEALWRTAPSFPISSLSN